MMHGSKFIKGVITGVAVSAAAAWWWNSEHGKATREKVHDSVDDFYDYMAPKLKRIQKMSRRKIQRIMRRALRDYADLKDLSQEKIDELKNSIHGFGQA